MVWDVPLGGGIYSVPYHNGCQFVHVVIGLSKILLPKLNINIRIIKLF